ncbi:MAG: hypothetical protein M3Q29_00755 [Chloroflexota bacterium]|nr:hypothetical protein [Chloroflexota bacterium]
MDIRSVRRFTRYYVDDDAFAVGPKTTIVGVPPYLYTSPSEQAQSEQRQ